MNTFSVDQIDPATQTSGAVGKSLECRTYSEVVPSRLGRRAEAGEFKKLRIKLIGIGGEFLA
jgi:hypothetical protein